LAISPYVADLRKRIGSSRLLMPSVSAIVYGPLGEILLVRQRDGNLWSTPGGSIEIDESPVNAVVRETWEETGLLVQPIALIGVFGGPGFVVRYGNGDETQYVTSVFECSVKSGELTNATDETIACRFISESEFRTLAASPWTREVLPLCYSRAPGPIIGLVTWAPPDSK
jgi:8-oxo-dGTP pyrophosphatase MutT (NUDIX family)